MIATNICGVLYLNLGRIGGESDWGDSDWVRRDLIGRTSSLSGEKMALFGRKMGKVSFVRVLNIFSRF